MNELEISRRSLFGRLFGGIALAVGATAAHAQIARIEVPPLETPFGSVTYTFDDEGRLLSVAHDGVARNVAAASSA